MRENVEDENTPRVGNGRFQIFTLFLGNVKSTNAMWIGIYH